MKVYLLLILVLLGLPLTSFNAESLQHDLTISISTDGVARVTENINTQTTISSINVQAISNKISKILAIDEKNIFLNTLQNDDLIRIDTLGASHVTLTYIADVTENISGIWHLDYNSDTQTIIILPSISNIVSVNDIPIDIEDDMILMPAGKISISYTIRTVTTHDFLAWDNLQSFPVQIMTASNIVDFKSVLKSIMFTVDEKSTVLVIFPKSFIPSPYEVLLNDEPIEFKPYYQNSTHSWVRFEPSEGGSLKVTQGTIPTDIVSQPLGGGCLIATATYGTEFATKVQMLREIRDNVLLQTKSGSLFMDSFNQFYYTFSPTVADWEREHPVFKESVKLVITPLLASLSILNYVDIDSEAEVLGYGISIIFLNIGTYFIVPAILITKLVKWKRPD